eukprot:NODE_291_length_10603_cov_1.029703.p8 type:complete len:143 gc:universal NODE_291_length_10603_cov_1.029703:6846-6418(-)
MYLIGTLILQVGKTIGEHKGRIQSPFKLNCILSELGCDTFIDRKSLYVNINYFEYNLPQICRSIVDKSNSCTFVDIDPTKTRILFLVGTIPSLICHIDSNGIIYKTFCFHGAAASLSPSSCCIMAEITIVCHIPCNFRLFDF